MRLDLLGTNGPLERPVTSAANEQPVDQSRSITAAIAWPCPMHIVAMP